MTREKRWTPGHWRVTDNDCAYALNAEGTNRFFASVQRGYEQDRHAARVPISMVEVQANAHLIAAAPELVEALEEALDELSDIHASFLDGIYNNPRINSALAKAYGDTPTEGTYGETEEG